MEQETQALLTKLRETANPDVWALHLGRYVSKGLRAGRLTIHEAYLLQEEVLTFTRLSYIQPAWHNRVRISILIQLLNMKLLSVLFQNEAGAALWTEWGMEAYERNQERRPHYIADDYPAFLHGEADEDRLKRLLEVRKSRRKPFDNGPYHTDGFPGEFCNVEGLLLAGERFPKAQPVRPEMEELLVELYLLRES